MPRQAWQVGSAQSAALEQHVGPSGNVAVRRYAHHIKSLGNWDDARHDGWRPEWERLRMRDPYEVLGVAKTASAAEIKSAFRRQAKKLHPDANKHDPRAAARFAELNAAYETVGEDDKRGQRPPGREVEVKLPAGLSEGQVIRLKGQRLAGSGGRAGDLLITVSVAPRPLFPRSGADLRLELPVTLYEAVLGAKVRVPT